MASQKTLFIAPVNAFHGPMKSLATPVASQEVALQILEDRRITTFEKRLQNKTREEWEYSLVVMGFPSTQRPITNKEQFFARHRV